MALGNLLAALKIAPSAAGYKNKQILRYYAIGESHGVSMTVTFHASLTMDRMQNLKKTPTNRILSLTIFTLYLLIPLVGKLFRYSAASVAKKVKEQYLFK